MSEAEFGTVLVTGGASGLGEAVARAIVGRGGTAVVLDRREPALDVDHELVDLADGRAAEQATSRVADRHPELRAVVTAAGTDSCGPLEKVSGDDWETVVKVNLFGTAAVIRASLPTLERNGGRIVTVASTLGLRPLPDATAYSASKFGVVGLSRALAMELADRVGVTLLIPGGMSTAFFDGRDPQYQPGPDAALNDPANVASAVLFALSQPHGCEVRELVVCPSSEPSWP